MQAVKCAGHGTDTKRHWQFSKFIRPGYARVSITGVIPPGVLFSAYKGGNGTVVMVAINKGDTTESLPLSINGGTAPASMVPWVTAAQGELIPNTAVAVSAGSFAAVLAAKSVTTFVGQ